MPSPIPSDRTQTTRIALISAIVVLAVVVTGMLAWAVLRPHRKAPAPRGFTPAEETSAGALPASRTVDATAPASAEASESVRSTPSVPASSAPAPGVVRAARIAFRMGSAIHVADENGGSSRKVAAAVDGEFSLSPDGLTLAVARAGNLALYRVDTGKLLFSAAGEAVPPVWLPDSSAVMFMRVGGDGSPEILRVSSSGGREALVGAGANMAVSPDGKVLVLVPALGSTPAPRLLVSEGGAPFVSVPVEGGDPLSVALANNRMFVSTVSATNGSSIWSFKLDGTDARRLVRPNSAIEKGATFGRMMLSPDGATLLYAAESDDGYSRMFVVPTKGGSPLSLSSARDDYPLRWSVSGTDILFIEGNAFQGEATALYHSSATGARRLMVLNGAGL